LERPLQQSKGLGGDAALPADRQVSGHLDTGLGCQLAVEVGLDCPTHTTMSDKAMHRLGNPPTAQPIPPISLRLKRRAGDRYPITECRPSRAGFPNVDPTAASGAEQRHQTFARCVLPEVDVLLRVALSLTRRPADAEDLVQDTLTRAYQGIDSFDGAHPRAWLLTIMRHAQINRTRRQRPELLDDQDAAFERLAATEGLGAMTPEGLVVGEMFDRVVSDALAALPDRFLAAVTLVDVDGLSYKEAAEVLGVPIGTVMSRLHRARARMRKRLVAAGLAPRRRL
jgi:RNA polymerase sigma-70 factor (ECF subfamily)